jgi:thiamine biosynthesis lipoprotein
MVMNTVLEQRIYGINAASAADKVCNEIRRLEKLWNCFDPDSLISVLNTMAGIRPVKLDPDTAAILRLSAGIAGMTDNTFDITVRPLVVTWRRAAAKGEIPARKTLEKALSLCGSAKIRFLNDDEVYLPQKGQAIDLGGIAKGYAADRAREIYLNCGIKHAVINFGGNVLVVGARPDGSPWKVGIQKPGNSRGNCFGFVEAADCAVVTSGSYERYFFIKKKKYSHIIDVRTGLPASTDLSSATVIAHSSALADALATAVMVLGASKSKAMFDDMDSLWILTLDKMSNIESSGGFPIQFKRI